MKRSDELEHEYAINCYERAKTLLLGVNEKTDGNTLSLIQWLMKEYMNFECFDEFEKPMV